MSMVLIDEINKVTNGFRGRIGVSVKNLESGEAASLNGDELFPTASVFKIPVIVEFYKQLESGILSLDGKIILKNEDMVPGSGILKELSEGLELTYRDLIELMMILSDNTATDLIVDKVGIDNVNSTLKELGLEKTKIVVGCREILFDLIGLNNLPTEEKTIDLYREKSVGAVTKGSWSLGVDNNDITTPNEMLTLLEMIARGEAASPKSCEAILATMKKCQTGAYRLVKYLPKDKIDFAHKTGSLPGIRNDVGMITFIENKYRYIICCFTMQAEDVYEADEIIAKVSQNVYNYFASD